MDNARGDLLLKANHLKDSLRRTFADRRDCLEPIKGHDLDARVDGLKLLLYDASFCKV